MVDVTGGFLAVELPGQAKKAAHHIFLHLFLASESLPTQYSMLRP